MSARLYTHDEFMDAVAARPLTLEDMQYREILPTAAGAMCHDHLCCVACSHPLGGPAAFLAIVIIDEVWTSGAICMPCSARHPRDALEQQVSNNARLFFTDAAGNA